MKAGIYDPYLDTIGGGERYGMTFAEALLKKNWQVDVFWPDKKIKEKITQKFSLDLDSLGFSDYSPLKRDFLEKIKEESKYDLLFYFSDGSIPLMLGKKNLLHFQVPFQKVGGRKLSNKLKLKKIDKIVCNSFFTKNIIEKEYGVRGEVWYPPVSIEDFSPGKKENIILAVGRFEKSLTEKRQDILIEGFKKMLKTGLQGWRLVIAGGCSTNEKDNEILTDLRKKAANLPIEIKVNISFLELKDLYSKAKIFWHAAGFGADETKTPEKVEHFGMTTVEAMAAGCVPIVINKGGQKEIISNNKDGFLWETIDDLANLTLKTISTKKIMTDLSAMTIKKAIIFPKKSFMKKFITLLGKLWPLLALGLIIRLVLMPVTLHPDLWAVSFAQNIFAFKGIFNIYDYLGNLPNDSALVVNYGRNFFTYPPLAYFTLGIFGFILKPLFNQSFFNSLAVILPDVLTDSRLYLHLFLTKLPYLFFDFGILFLLNAYFQEEKKKKLAVMLWIFNPVVLYTTYMIGQFDIIPVFFTVLSLYLAKQKKIYWSVFCLGIGGAFKMYPLFFIPFLIIVQNTSFKESLKLAVAGLTPYFLSILPFLGSVNFRQAVLFSNQSQKMLFAKIPVSGAEYLSVFVVLYFFLVGLVFLKKAELWKWFLVVLLLFFSVTHYHPQWFLWLSPFLVFFLVDCPRFRILPVILFLCWLLITLLFEPSLSVSLFAPLNKSLMEAKPLSETINNFYNVFDFKSLVRSAFAGTALLMSVIVLKKPDGEREN